MFHSIKYAWKWFSVQIAALATIIAFAQDELPLLKDNLPSNWYKYVLIAIIVARLYKQDRDRRAASAGQK